MLRLVILRLLESYFRHRWLYLLPIVLMTAAAIAYYLLLKPVFIARGVFYVQQESLLTSITSLRDVGYTWETPAQTTSGEFSELLQTDAFVRSVIERTDLEAEMAKGTEVVQQTIEEVRESVWLSTLGNNQIRIQAQHESPSLSQQLVTATFDTFLQWKINADRNEGQVAADFLVGLVADYKVELETARQTLNEYLIAHPEPLRGDRPAIEALEIRRLESEINLAQDRYSSALDKDEDARLSVAQAANAIRQTYFLIDAPEIPTEPGTSLKEIVINMLIFMVVGVILSIVGIVGGALLDRTLRFPIDVSYGLRLPVLTEIRNLTPKKSRWRRKTSRQSEAKLPVQEQARGEMDSKSMSVVDNGAVFPVTESDVQPEEIEDTVVELVK
ncbi:MAG: lipopolysaccharide biosynthesis protein [Chloroflexota bacterium]